MLRPRCWWQTTGGTKTREGLASIINQHIRDQDDAHASSSLSCGTDGGAIPGMFYITTTRTQTQYDGRYRCRSRRWYTLRPLLQHASSQISRALIVVKDTLLCVVVGVSNGEVMIDLNMKRSPMCRSLLPACGPISRRLRSGCALKCAYGIFWPTNSRLIRKLMQSQCT